MKKLGIVIVLVVGIGFVLWAKQKDKMPSSGDTASSQPVANVSASPTALVLPRLLDLGADKCIPCKMMKPILEELKKEFEGKLQVDFIDVWENPGAGEQYGIQSIPTQIFYDSSGKELYRHVGFFSKADILGKWKELGITFEKGNRSGR
ncbi:MAG: thioredoxin family protein [Phycisphaerae bacterium]